MYRRQQAGAIGTGQAAKYSPIAQQRAQKAGFGVPDKVEKQVADLGQIAPR